MSFTREELNQMTRESVDPVGFGPVTRPHHNVHLPDDELRRRILQRNASREPTFLLRFEYERRLYSKAAEAGEVFKIDPVPPTPSAAESGYIFISYKREDLPGIIQFMHRIVGWGYPIWYDRGIPGGAEWDAFIEQKVANCEILLVFLSEAAVESKWVRREIKLADSEDRPILGIRLDKNVELKHGLKVVMNQYQMIDASDADFSDELRTAIEYVRLL